MPHSAFEGIIDVRERDHAWFEPTGSARSLHCEWILGETTDLHRPGLPLEMLAVPRNFFTENCSLVGVGRGK